jgi:hypothetical protein
MVKEDIHGLDKKLKSLEEKYFSNNDILNEDLMQISEIAIQHPGGQIWGMSQRLGKFYKINKNTLDLVNHKDSCTCDNPQRHKYHLEALKVFTEMIENRIFLLKGSGDVLDMVENDNRLQENENS